MGPRGARSPRLDSIDWLAVLHYIVALVSRRRAAVWVAVASSLSATALAADWVGAQTCKTCHSQAYESWANDPHAHAADGLTEAQRRQPSCTHCHAPELAARAGNLTAASRALSPDQTRGISCESCHGAGQYYSPAYVMKDSELSRAVGLQDPGERSCKACHLEGAPSLAPFEFATKVKLIDHWSAERAARKGTAQADAPADPASNP